MHEPLQFKADLSVLIWKNAQTPLSNRFGMCISKKLLWGMQLLPGVAQVSSIPAQTFKLADQNVLQHQTLT